MFGIFCLTMLRSVVRDLVFVMATICIVHPLRGVVSVHTLIAADAFTLTYLPLVGQRSDYCIISHIMLV